MRVLSYILSILAVVTLGYWSYRESYQTRDVQRAVRALQQEIGERHRKLGMLRAEWAYLNRPDRLAVLVEMNFERLQLMPLTPDHFAHVDQVAFPPPAPVWPHVLPDLAADLGDILVMNHQYGADAGPRVIAPPTLADDGEMLP
jgi:hypothetical protein